MQLNLTISVLNKMWGFLLFKGIQWFKWTVFSWLHSDNHWFFFRLKGNSCFGLRTTHWGFAKKIHKIWHSFCVSPNLLEVRRLSNTSALQEFHLQLRNAYPIKRQFRTYSFKKKNNTYSISFFFGVYNINLNVCCCCCSNAVFLFITCILYNAIQLHNYTHKNMYIKYTLPWTSCIPLLKNGNN